MKINFLVIVILILSTSLKAQELRIYFPFDSYELTKKQQKEIEIFINNSFDCDLQINGYADTIGSLDYNQTLSQKRVIATQRIICKINPNVSFSTQSFGEVKSTDDNQKLNRKVELIAINTYKPIVPIYKEPQVFLVNNSKDTIIICAEGSRIKIPKESFDIPKEQITKKNIKFNVTEYYSTNDILKANLTTTSNNRTLETGGMLFIEAFINNKKCQLEPNKKLGLSFRNINPTNNMQIFYGEENKNQINWVVSSESDEVQILENDNVTFGAEEQIFFIVEKMPEFIGGQEGLQEYIKKNTRYPLQAYEAGIQGKVIIQYEVESDGSVQNVRVIRGISPSLDFEAYNVVKSMPKWKPGTQRGKAVSVSLTVLINFDLNEMNRIDSTNRIISYEQLANIMDTNSTYVPPVSKQEKQNMADYFMWTGKMDWINCDRLYSYNGKNVYVNVNTKNESIKAIFNNQRSIVSAQLFDSKNMNKSFGGLPQNQEIIILGIRHNSSGIFLGLKKVKANNQEIELNYYKVENLDFKKLLDEI